MLQKRRGIGKIQAGDAQPLPGRSPCKFQFAVGLALCVRMSSVLACFAFLILFAEVISNMHTMLGANQVRSWHKLELPRARCCCILHVGSRSCIGVAVLGRCMACSGALLSSYDFGRSHFLVGFAIFLSELGQSTCAAL